MTPQFMAGVAALIERTESELVLLLPMTEATFAPLSPANCWLYPPRSKLPPSRFSIAPAGMTLLAPIRKVPAAISVLSQELPVEAIVHVELSVLLTCAVGRLITPLTAPRPPVPRKVSLPVYGLPLIGPLTSNSALAASAARAMTPSPPKMIGPFQELVPEAV